MKKKVIFIVNPRSGIGKQRKIVSLLDKYLDKDKFDYQLLFTQYRGHALELAQQAIEQQVDIAVAVGGDGTISEVAKALNNTEIALGILPSGSGNGLARHLHIPIRLSKALQVLNKAHIETIDTIDINGQTCVSVAGIGFDAYIAKKFDKSSSRGFFPYFRFVVGSFFWYKSHTYVVETEGKTTEHKAMLVCIANSSQWGFNVKIAPQASLQDGLADVCIVPKPPLWLLPFRLFMLLIGKLHKDKLAVIISSVSQCTIYEKERRWQYCHLDGDPIGRQQKIEVKVKPNTLKVVSQAFI